MADFNGIVVFRDLQPIAGHIFVDSSLFAFGGVFGREAYHLTLPPNLQGQNISFLELLNVYVTLCFWGDSIRGQSVAILCDNMSAVNVLW